VHDALIVGAGPGGSAAAHFLAKRGLDVLLLDKSTFPRDKTCGDGLTPRALRVLDEMGILADVARHGRRIAGYEVVAPNGRRTRASITNPLGALVVRRYQLDDLIRGRALESGARFEPGVTARRVLADAQGVALETRDGKQLRARTAVIATGASTSLLMESGILKQRPRAMLAARAYFDAHDLTDQFQLRFDGVPLPGYGWIFPVEAGLANIGVGFLPGRKSEPTQVALRRFLEGKGVRQVGPVKGFPIRVDFLGSPTYGDRILLVGEAAGLVNPLTGEGIDYALESGRIAAQQVASCFESGDFSTASLSRYHLQIHMRFAKVFRFSEHVRDWYCRPPLLNMLVPLANHRPELRQLLASIVLGEREPAGYGPLTMLARLLVYLARTRPHRSFA
jgi:menaquinone-9 beta-reductase